jgi:hypothetical protein
VEKLWSFFASYYKEHFPESTVEYHFAPSGLHRNAFRGEVSRVLGVSPEGWQIELDPHASSQAVDFHDGTGRLYQLVNNPRLEKLWRHLQHPLVAYYEDKPDLEPYRIFDSLGIYLSGPYVHSDEEHMDDGCHYVTEEAVRSFGL